MLKWYGIATLVFALSNGLPACGEKHCEHSGNNTCFNVSDCLTCDEAGKRDPAYSCSNGPCPGGGLWLQQSINNMPSGTIIMKPESITTNHTGNITRWTIADSVSFYTTITIKMKDGSTLTLDDHNTEFVNISVERFDLTTEQADRLVWLMDVGQQMSTSIESPLN